jgi:hypothetical protein
MPHRYRILEKLAFASVTICAAACSTYVAYETSPEVRSQLQFGKYLFLRSGEYYAYTR